MTLQVKLEVVEEEEVPQGKENTVRVGVITTANSATVSTELFLVLTHNYLVVCRDHSFALSNIQIWS